MTLAGTHKDPGPGVRRWCGQYGQWSESEQGRAVGASSPLKRCSSVSIRALKGRDSRASANTRLKFRKPLTK